jgi:chaperone required for assembly of F1-ATPase
MTKRFYDEVSVCESAAGGWQVTLDGRGLKTLKGSPQTVPSQALADALAQEWAVQTEDLDPKSFPVRDLVDYALDIVTPDPAAIADKIVQYGDTDTLLYRADAGDALHIRQQEVWEPVVSAFEAREGVALTRVSGIVHQPQSQAAMARLRARLLEQSPIALAAIEAMTSLAGSLVISLSACEADADPVALWNAAALEEEWQADLWGREYEAERRRAKRQDDFLKAHGVTRLCLEIGTG